MIQEFKDFLDRYGYIVIMALIIVGVVFFSPSVKDAYALTGYGFEPPADAGDNRDDAKAKIVTMDPTAPAGGTFEACWKSPPHTNVSLQLLAGDGTGGAYTLTPISFTYVDGLVCGTFSLANASPGPVGPGTYNARLFGPGGTSNDIGTHTLVVE